MEGMGFGMNKMGGKHELCFDLSRAEKSLNLAVWLAGCCAHSKLQQFTPDLFLAQLCNSHSWMGKG